MEDESSLLYKSIGWIANHRRTVLFLGLMVFLLLFGLYIFTTYALVSVEVDADFEAKDVAIYTGSNSNAETMEEAGEPGLVLLPRSTDTLVVSSGENIKTRVKLEIPWYGFASKKVSLHRDKNAEKIAFRSTTASTCALYRAPSDTLAFYNCQKPNAGLFEYQAPSSKPWSLKKLRPLQYPINQPESGNHLGITSNTDTSSTGLILGLNEQNETISYIAPLITDERTEQIRMSRDHHSRPVAPVRIYSDKSNTKNNRFVVVSQKGDIFIGTPTGGHNVSYHTIAAPSDYFTSYNQTLCSLNSKYVYCYRGPAVIGDTPPEYDFSRVTQSQLVVYSFADQTEKTFTFSSNLFTLTSIHLTDEGDVFGLRFGELYHFKKSGDVYTAVELSRGVSAVAAGDKLYYVNDDGVYTLDETDTTTAYQVFYSPNVQPKAIYPVNGKVFIIGSTPFDASTTHAYELTDEDNLSPGDRLIDIFPSDSRLPEMVSNDLVGDKLLVRLSVPFGRDRAGNKRIDPGEVAASKGEVMNFLRAEDIPIDPDNIVFVY